MNKQNIIVGLLFVVLLTLNFTIKPYLRQRDTVRIIEAVLTHWENGDLTLAIPTGKIKLTHLLFTTC